MRLREAFERSAISEVVDYDDFREHCPTAHVAIRRQGDVLFDVGDEARSFGFVVSGRVKLVVYRDKARESILDFVQPGACVCPVKPHAREVYCCRAVAADAATRLVVVNYDEALNLVRHVPETMTLFVRLVSDRAAQMCARVGDLSSGSVTRRIAGLLCRLARLGTEHEGVIRIELALSRRDLAEMSGTRVETAIRAVRSLEKAGVLRTHGWGFEVLDGARLEEAAGAPVLPGSPCG